MKIGYTDIAKQFIGVKENSITHHQLVDAYNTIKPLPRGYKVKYNDSWCAVFVSAILSTFKTINPPYECSADRMYRLCKYNGQIINKPKKDCLIFYSWKCNGIANHVGFVSSVKGNVITTIEGNKSDMVGVRKILINNIYILGYADIKNKGGVNE